MTDEERLKAEQEAAADEIDLDREREVSDIAAQEKLTQAHESKKREGNSNAFKLAHIIGLAAIALSIVSLSIAQWRSVPAPRMTGIGDPIVSTASDGATMCLQHALTGWTCHKVIR